MGQKGWIGVDFDATLVTYDKWVSVEHIGEPVWPMITRVKEWLLAGQEVRIFTARVYPEHSGGYQIVGYSEEQLRQMMEPGLYFTGYARVAQAALAKLYIERWCEKMFGQKLKVTCTKDPGMIQLWDDRCVQVEPNTGQLTVEAALQLYQETKVN